MTTPLSQFPKPEAGQYEERRKLFLVPNLGLPSEAPEEGMQLLERYWTEVRDHIGNLERSLEKITHVYHETVFGQDEEGMKLLEVLNPRGFSFIQAMCQSSAKLEALEDRALVEESSDWQRCLSIGLVSEKVMRIAMEGFQEATRKRFEHMRSRIDETLKEGEVGVLFVREDHRIQFPTDIAVFYVAPPTLNVLKRWMDDQIRAAERIVQQTAQSEQAEEADQADQADQVQRTEQSERAEQAE